ncbi:glycosyltransferase family 2 protein [Ningiella sp. W23]|uniref:glycosyltransferase family 2 protein n=1 Tax=Ningiella sp. W23 TaxID=3023715 RepID=UPI00375771AF
MQKLNKIRNYTALITNSVKQRLAEDTKKSNSPRVKIVAVAKDEAAYLPEWAFHHIYIGVNAIDVYVNRTSDNTLAMINEISKSYPSVNAIAADCFDDPLSSGISNMQVDIYKHAFQVAQAEGKFDYLLFIDIDEFWVNRNFDVKIQDVIDQAKAADVYCFEWLNEMGHDNDFSTLSSNGEYKLHFLVKSLVKTQVKNLELRLHRPKVFNETTVMCDGEPFVAGKQGDEALHESLIKVRECMIIHRMFRSPTEYVSLLQRGRPSEPATIKLNRGGYNQTYGDLCRFNFDEGSFLRYEQAKLKFLQKKGIKRELATAKQFVKSRYFKTIDSIKTIPHERFTGLLQVFINCGKAEKNLVVEHVMSSSYTTNCKNVEWISKLALKMELLDKSAALKLWRQAFKLRPNGPLILKKLTQLEECERSHHDKSIVKRSSKVLNTAKPLVFVHIPKTAGTSLIKNLAQAYHSGEILYDYGENSKRTSDLILKHCYHSNDLDSLASVDISLIAGHFYAKKYIKITAPENVVTFVREPIERVISEFKHFQRHHSYTGTLIDFAKKKRNRNVMSKFLSTHNWKDFGFVGVTEQYNASVEILQRFISKDIEISKLNTAPEAQSVEVDNETLGVIQALNRADTQLYNEVKTYFEQKLIDS